VREELKQDSQKLDDDLYTWYKAQRANNTLVTYASLWGALCIASSWRAGQQGLVVPVEGKARTKYTSRMANVNRGRQGDDETVSIVSLVSCRAVEDPPVRLRLECG